MLGSQLFCTTMWKMWFYRNQVVFNQISPYPHIVANAALDFIVEFNHTMQKKRNQLQPHGAAAVAAAPSPVCNAHVIQVDAGCFPEGFTTFDCVFKDGRDSVYFSACNKEEVSIEPVLAEALAIRWCLQLAKEKGLQDVTIQSDALAVVECFRGSNSLASIDLIVQDCKALMEDFSSVSINYVCRNLNVLAHRLVGHAVQAGCNSWVGYAFPITSSATVCNTSVI